MRFFRLSSRFISWARYSSKISRQDGYWNLTMISLSFSSRPTLHRERFEIFWVIFGDPLLALVGWSPLFAC